MPESNDTTSALLDRLYQENAKVAAIFWDWRHKLLAFSFAIVSALAAGAAWAASHQVNSYAIAGGFAVAAILSFSAALLNKRTAEIIEKTYVAGAVLEAKIQRRIGEFQDDDAMFFTLMKQDKATETSGVGNMSFLRKPTFGRVMNGAFYVLSGIFVLMVILTFMGVLGPNA